MTTKHTISNQLHLTPAEIAEVLDQGRTVLVDPDRWGTEANPEGRIAIVEISDGKYAVISAEERVFEGPLTALPSF